MVPSNKQLITTYKRQRKVDSEFQFMVGRVHPVKFTTRQLKEAEQGSQGPNIALGKDESNKS